MSISAQQWLQLVHNQINDSIQSKKTRGWSEDGITERILEDLTSNLPAVTIQTATGHSHISMAWDAYKLSGALEYNFGDIAFLVRLSFANGVHKEGVAFLEAKRIYKKSKRYDWLNQKQLDAHLKNTHAHRTLLYDYEDTLLHLDNIELQYYCQGLNYSPLDKNYAHTLHSEHVLSLNDRSRKLYENSLPLSFIITTRYLKGFELDFSANSVSRAKGYLDKEGRGGIRYLVVAHVSMNPEIEPFPDKIEINREIYMELKHQDKGHVAESFA